MPYPVAARIGFPVACKIAAGEGDSFAVRTRKGRQDAVAVAVAGTQVQVQVRVQVQVQLVVRAWAGCRALDLESRPGMVVVVVDVAGTEVIGNSGS